MMPELFFKLLADLLTLCCGIIAAATVVTALIVLPYALYCIWTLLICGEGFAL